MLELRLLPTLAASGPEQMARDEALLESAAERGVASFRFYRWTEPTLSLGYFQQASERTGAFAPLAWVRRASGGAAILHHASHELTYSFALPTSAAAIPGGESWICRVHYAIRDCLKTLGIRTRAVICGEENKIGDFLCFLHHTPGDLVLDGSKVVGSAQRKLRGAILQHGTILLSTSAYTSQLPGLAELSGKAIDESEFMAGIQFELGRQLGWSFAEGVWTADELEVARRIGSEKYRSREWNDRR